MLRKTILGVLAVLAVSLGSLTAPASAGTLSAQPTAVASGDRVVVTIKGKKPTKATLIVGGTRYQLKRKGKVWRTKPLSAEALAGISGAKAKVKVRVKGKNKTLKTSIQGTGTNPTPGTPGTPGGGAQPLFAAPGVDSTGNAAWEAVKGYFLNSTFTDCPAGWPNCAVEYRYGHFDNLSMAYCRLTNTAGADIINGRKPIYIAGAEQKADGSWAVSYQEDYGDGYQRWYTWYVATNGSVTGYYWYNANPANSAPTEQISGLVWVRGARDCSY